MELARNNLIFNKKKKTLFNLLLSLIVALPNQVNIYIFLLQSLLLPPLLLCYCVTVQISWKKPFPPLFKLHCNGSAKDNLLGAGGIIRDHSGNQILGFFTFLGSGYIIKAELWSILHGLKLACDFDTSHLIIEINSSLMVNLIIDTNVSSHHSLFSLINNCICYLHLFEETKIQHVFREANQPADLLANWGRDSSCSHTLFNSMPPFISMSCFYDSMSFNYPKTNNVCSKSCIT